jgi:tetratricopeptide (TPR) repeat protein
MTLLSTGSASLDTIDAELERSASEYKESPKIWLLRAKVAELDGRVNDVPIHLYRAHAINPQHRNTMLELARWHARQGAYGTAFSLFDQLQDRYSVDVEVAIERYVLGQITGKDPNEAQAINTLAGLVREEIPEVAKDEAGRTALGFAVAKLGKGDVVEGLEELSKADAAFSDSAVFKTALAGVYLAMGDFAKAREQYSRALELEPNNPQHRVGLARATLLERSGRKVTADEEKKRLKDKPMKNGVADLPFATVRFELGRFELVEVEPDASFFPEGEYWSLSKDLQGKELTNALEAASIRMLARLKTREGKHDEAINLLKEALKLADDPSSEYALGLVHLSKKDFDEAERLLKNAIDKDDDAVAARLALARAYLGKSDEAKALQVLDQIDGSVLAPDALLMKARLKVQRGDYEGALVHLEPLGGLLPANTTVQILHGEALQKLGRNADADQAFERALSINGKMLSGDPPVGADRLSGPVLVGLGRVEVKRNPKRALSLLRAAEKKDDAPDEVHLHLGEAYLATKKKKDAERELKKFLKVAEEGELKTRAQELLKKR